MKKQISLLLGLILSIAPTLVTHGQIVTTPDLLLIGKDDIPSIRQGDAIFLWSQEFKALMAGGLQTIEDPSTIGEYSAIFGSNNISSGRASVVSGQTNFIHGSNSTSFGRFNIVSGNNSSAHGADNLVRGNISSVHGSNNKVFSDMSMAWGSNVSAAGVASTVYGVGSEVDSLGATAWGSYNVAKHEFTTAWGSNNRVTAPKGTAWGNSNEVRAGLATAWGNDNVAAQINSTVWGEQNLVNATYATSWGWRNSANCFNSTAIGHGNNASSKNGLVVGQFNSGTNPCDNPDNDPHARLFVVDNGDSFNERSNALVVTKEGHVGIGVDQPKAPLHIDGEIILGNGEKISDEGIFRIGFNSSLIPSNGFHRNIGSTTNPWGSIYLSNTVIQSSDRRLKQDIQDISYGLDAVLQLKPSQYRLKANPTDVHLGLIAQELQEVIPELVNVPEDADSYLAVKYTELIPVLIKAIQEQQSIITKLQETTTALQDQLAQIADE